MLTVGETEYVTIKENNELWDGFIRIEVTGIGYEPIVYACKVIERAGSGLKEFKKDEELTIRPYTGEILGDGGKTLKSWLFNSELLGLQTAQWRLLEEVKA